MFSEHNTPAYCRCGKETVVVRRTTLYSDDALDKK